MLTQSVFFNISLKTVCFGNKVKTDLSNFEVSQPLSFHVPSSLLVIAWLPSLSLLLSEVSLKKEFLLISIIKNCSKVGLLLYAE